MTLKVYFIKNTRLTSRLIRLVTSVRYGIPLKECLSHIECSYDDKQNISAEGSGVKLVPNDRHCIEKHLHSIWEFVNPIDELRFLQITEDLLGRKYGYLRYAVDSSRIFAFCSFFGALLTIPVALLITKIFFLTAFLACMGGIFLGLDKLALKNDGNVSDCSKTSGTIMSGLGLYAPFSSKVRNEFPNQQLGVMETLALYGIVKRIK